VVSPNGQVVATVAIKDFDGAPKCLVYRVSYRGQTVVTDSRLGLEFAEGLFQENLQLDNQSHEQQEQTWTPVYGERSRIRDAYRETTFRVRETEPPHRHLDVVFRAYDEGVAFCYRIPRQEGAEQARIRREQSEFHFTADHDAWAVYSAQGRYARVALSQIKPGCERPLTIRVNDSTYLALAEARLVDYARTKFAPLKEGALALVTHLDGEVVAALPLTTPWRVIMVGDRPGQLLERNDLIRNLNNPCAIADPSWIRPGKVIREVTLTTSGGKACVDFAVRNNLQFVEFDAGWYGHEYSDDSDATTVTVDPKRSPGPLDLPEVIRYARERGIGVLLYVNRRALERQLDTILPLYREWGVAGVKYGFVRVGSQEVTTWLHMAVRKAAENRLMVDIHDEYRPTGYSRTYPNLMTQEGIAGDETSPTNQLTLTILFTRMLAGAGDNTICYYDSRVTKNASHAYQLAKAVCLYSPWQFVYWYDRPPRSPQEAAGAGGEKRLIGDEPELEFFAHVPTVWDDTRVIHGEIGEYAVIARRRGEQWFVGCMNGAQPRVLELPLDFLDPDAPYTAHIYYDDPAVSTRTHVGIRRTPVDASHTLDVGLPANGGQAIRLEKR
jgi:alpha-glucosidase